MLQVFLQYTSEGFAHILPNGMDHVLFVLGLFLICREFSTLLWQVTLFTVAHSFSLGLSMAGIVQLPSHLVEVLIALSIAFVALENLLQRDVGRWRPFVVGASGLVHGLGFAHAFQEQHFPQSDPLAALLGMSVGVELGQMTVVTVAYLTLGMYWARPWYRAGVTVPGSVFIFLSGLGWLAARV